MDNAACKQQIDNLQKVLDVTRAMVATEDLDGLLALIVERGMQLLRAERATVFLYDEPADQLVSRIAHGTDEIRISAGTGIAGAVVRGGKVVNVPDAYADPRFNQNVDRQTGFRTRNILSIPMHGYEGNLVGVMQVLNKREGAFDEHDITLAETLAAQAGVAIQRASLIAHYLQKQKMERAMQIAQEIQQALLPKEAPRMDGFEVAGFSKPADETGGDTYDFMMLPSGQCMFTVADATGHGIGPALIIAEARAMLRAQCYASENPQPDTILSATNDLLASDLTDGRFVTCFFGLLDPSASKLTYVSAGHGPNLFYHASEDRFDEEGATGLPMGVMEGMPFGAMEHTFCAGDFALIMTDGFFEAIGPDGDEFGVHRVMDLLRKHRREPAGEMIAHLYAAVKAFTEGKPQADDLTAILLRKSAP